MTRLNTHFTRTLWRGLLLLGATAMLALALQPTLALGEEPAREPQTAPPAKPTNKLLNMYRLFYLPFSIEFKEGRSKDEILPFLNSSSGTRLITAPEMMQLDQEWKQMRAGIRPKSLLLSTRVPLDETVKLSTHLFAHKIPIIRSAFDRISIGDRLMMAKALEGKPDAVKYGFRQLQFLKSFLKGSEPEGFHFFIVGPNWCKSTQEYRMMLETYFKRFPQKDLSIHSIIVEDPEEKIFESRAMGELFPNKEKYSHDNVPRFLALEIKDGKPIVWEEGQALEQLLGRYFAKYRGHFDSKTSLFGGRQVAGRDRGFLDPKLSSAGR